MSKKIELLAILLFLLSAFSSFSQSSDTTVYLQSEVLGEKRSITIGLPRNYQTSDQAYACLYVLDAEYKYDISRSIHQFFEISTQLPNTIIIGISNSSKESRNRDLLPSNFQGKDSLFRDFVQNEVIPYVEGAYRCNSDRIIFGHSHGGVFAVNTLLQKPALFNKYIAADASFQIINSNLPDSLSIDLTGKSLYICSSDGLYGFGEEISSDMRTNNMIFQNYRLQNKHTGLRFYAEHIADDHSHTLITGFSRGFRWIMGWPISNETLKGN